MVDESAYSFGGGVALGTIVGVKIVILVIRTTASNPLAILLGMNRNNRNNNNESS
jgi:predicted metalloprotease